MVEHRRLAWTTVLQPGFRPTVVAEHDLPFTARLSFEPEGAGTRYVAHVLHGDETSAKRHAEMGFHDGWGKALEQLVGVVKGL